MFYVRCRTGLEFEMRFFYFNEIIQFNWSLLFSRSPLSIDFFLLKIMRFIYYQLHNPHNERDTKEEVSLGIKEIVKIMKLVNIFQINSKTWM